MKATTVLVRQHQRIDQLLSALEHERFFRASLLRELSDELAAHLRAEERLLARDVLRELARGCDTSQASESVMNMIDELTPLAAPESERAPFVQKLAELRTIVSAHRAAEESALMPALEKALSEQAHERLGIEIEALHASVRRERADGAS